MAGEAARVLENAAKAMCKAVAMLPEARKRAQEILVVCTEISTLESEADALYRSAIAELFKAGHDALMVMKWRDIHEQLESATDLCEDVAMPSKVWFWSTLDAGCTDRSHCARSALRFRQRLA